MAVTGVSRLLTCVAWLSLAACGNDRGPLDWVDSRAAVVHCTSAGPDRMPPVLLGMPVPHPPTGLYARRMDPMGLGDLGYARDTVACAMLIAPEPEEASQVQDDLEQTLTLRAEVSRAAIKVAGRCTCEAAQVLGIRNLVEGCARTPALRGCDPSRYALAVQAAMEPLVQSLPSVELPLVHWRLVGRTDREGWFAEHHHDLIDRHAGGSTVFIPGQPMPTRNRDELVAALLEVEDVTAVVRQDGGRALLVVRELGSRLVLDHFEYAAVDPSLVSLLPFLDAANPDAYLQRLDKPASTRKLSVDPADGNLVEVDRPLLDQVDALVLAAAPLAGGYDADQAERSQPEPFVQRVSLQAPFGAQGEVLRARLELTEAGTKWAQSLSEDLLTPTLSELGLSDEAPTYTPPPNSRLIFALQGTVTDAVLLQGIHRVPDLMRRIEMNHPSSIQGRRSAWRFELPASTFEGVLAKDDPFSGLREQLSKKPYLLETSLSSDRDVLGVQLAPR